MGRDALPKDTSGRRVIGRFRLQSGSATPCIHLGEPTGDTRDSRTCGGGKNIPLVACAVHGVCTTQRCAAPVAWCRTCKDYQASAQPVQFDRVYLINLKRRTDRLEQFRTFQQQRGWKLPEPIVYPAIHGDTVGVPPSFTQRGGAYGCKESHCRILQDCLMDGVESVLVFEDDAEWFEGCWERLDIFLRAVPRDWCMLMLGGQHMQNPEEIAPGVGRVLGAGRTHAYAVHRRAMKSLLSLWYEANCHIDWPLPGWHKDWWTYCPLPFLFGQSAGRSDICGRTTADVSFWGAIKDASASKTDTIYSHAGDIGDLIAALPVLAQRPGVLRLVQDKCTGGRMTPERAESLRSFLLAQEGVQGVEWAAGYEGERLDKGVRQFYQHNLNLADMQGRPFGCSDWPREKPWLRVASPRKEARVVFARSHRYRSPAFPWKRAWEKYHAEAVFIGTTQEHADFCREVGDVPHCLTPAYLDLAKVVAGAELVVVNQTSIFWLAEGLKRPLVLEAGKPDNCNFARRGHLHATDKDVVLPDLDGGNR